MIRGDVYDVNLNPTVGMEQSGWRPFIIVSPDDPDRSLPMVIGVPCTSMRPQRLLPPAWVLIAALEGGLGNDTVALCNQVRALSTTRLGRLRGQLSMETMARIDQGLRLALGLLG